MALFNRVLNDGKSSPTVILKKSIGFFTPFQFGVAVSYTDQPDDIPLRLCELAREYDLAIVVLKQQTTDGETFEAYILSRDIPNYTAICKESLRSHLSAKGYLVKEQLFTPLSGPITVIKIEVTTQVALNLILGILEAQALIAGRQVDQSTYHSLPMC